jgi:hypothetical protein
VEFQVKDVSASNFKCLLRYQLECSSANSNSGNSTIKIFWKYDRKEELMGQCNVSIPELLQQQGASKSGVLSSSLSRSCQLVTYSTGWVVVKLELQLKNKSSGQVFVQLSADREATALPVPPVPPVQTRTSTPQNRQNSQAIGTSARKWVVSLCKKKYVFTHKSKHTNSVQTFRTAICPAKHKEKVNSIACSS